MIKNDIILKTITFTIFAFTTCCIQQSTDNFDEISNVNKVFTEAFNGGNITKASLVYMDSAKLFIPNSDVISGRKSIASFWRKTVESGVEKMELKIVTMEGQGDLVAEEGRYKLFVRNNLILDEGKYIKIWKKVDDSWLINRFMCSSNLPFSVDLRIPKGYVLGIHQLEVTPKENTTYSDFEKFYKEYYIPANEKSYSGLQLYLLKAERGENSEKYGELYFIRSEEERDHFEPDAGILSDKGQEAYELLKPTQDKLDSLVKIDRVFTDWVVQ
ncbi:DUF4440 domain-containing protein [Gaetbulibacter sp. M240]|uniref:YybH family protein n=1 Tax=Gaetbulibacter sp. M240 TaxID=3126511 RepID=UPI00374E2742